MKKRFFILFIAIILVIAWKSLSSSPDGAPSGYANDKASSYKTCASSGCHTGMTAINLPNAIITSTIPSTGYVGGQTYHVTASITSAHTRFGFEVTPQDSVGNYKGNIIVTNNSLTKVTGTKYITHTQSGNSLKTWSFDWVAPAIGSGAVQFSGCILSANNNGSSSGDSTYKIGFIANDCFKAPSNIIATPKGTSSTITWDKITCGTGYKIIYHILGATTWKTLTLADTSSKILSALSYNTTYEYSIASMNGTTLSAYSPIKQFTTLCQCDLPTMSIDSIGTKAVRFVWIDDACGVRYKIQYRKSGVISWTSKVAIDTTTNLVATNMTANTIYEWRFRRECNMAGTYSSVWSATYQFTTALLKNPQVVRTNKIDNIIINVYDDGSVRKFIKQ